MNESTITVRYAKALFQVGEETNNLENIKSGVDIIYSTLRESVEFNELLKSPVIKTSEKSRIFSELFAKHIDPLLINFFSLLTNNKREQYLVDICLNFLQRYKENKGVKEAVITTAKELSDDYKAEILKLLTKKLKQNIELTTQVNPELIGGFKLRIDDEQLDASISSQLRKIRTELINS